VEFRILGPLEVLDGDRPIALPGGRGRALVAVLILNAGEVVSTERIIDELWGESPPSTVRTALQGLVSSLRKRLQPAPNIGEGPAVLHTVPPGYVLSIDPTDVDAHRFRRLLEEARAAPASERSARLRKALNLWRGPALADFTYEPFAQREITVLEELRLAAIEERVEAELALGLHTELVAEVETLVAEHPFRERLRGQLMVALYRAGRQAEALEAYRRARETLVEELGIEPSPALRHLEQAILRQDPSLDLYPLGDRELSAQEPPAPVAGARPEPWLLGERRIVTVVFVDLAVPLASGESRDPEALRRVVGPSLDDATAVLRRHGASVEELVGDVLVGLFGLPTAHEDDALRAVRAAAEVRGALTTLNEEVEGDRGIRLPARIGVETGEVVVGLSGSGHATASGDAVNQAARLQRAAGEGEVLVGDGTRAILRDGALLEPVAGVGSGGPGGSLAAWRLIDLVAAAPAVARRLDVPMVGRAAELVRLHGAFERAVRQGTGYRLTVLGDPGIGKSRLAREFARALGSGARVLTGHCPPYGEGITFWPLREAVLQAASPGGSAALAELLRGEDDGEWIAGQVAAAIGLTQEPGRADELFPAVRRLFEALAARRPLVVVLEDVHWGEPTLLDLIEHLAENARGPIFLLCLARPELIEERPAWGVGRRSVDTLFLEPLGRADTEELIADRLAGYALPEETVARIVETAQGNPLFVEQMVAAFQEEGADVVPASVHGLLAARLDRLGPAERDLLRCAAVVGPDFASDALTALVPEQARSYVDRHLQALERKQLIHPARSLEMGFSFRHVLIQLVAYRSMTREDRARLHQRYAEWLESEAREHPPELNEILGYHLEQAVKQRRRAIGVLDEHDPDLAARAGEHLSTGGLRAFGRFDLTASENLLSRAKALLPSSHPQRPRVMRHLAEAYQVLGRHGEADAELAELVEGARAEGDRSLEQDIRLERARVQVFTGPDPVTLEAIRHEAEQSLQMFEGAGDESGMARAYFVLGYVHIRAGNVRETEEAFRRSLDHANRSGDIREEAAARWLLADAIVLGPTPVPDCIRLCEELVPWRDREHPGVLSELGSLQAMLGEFDRARELGARARRLFLERIRARRPLMFVAQSSGAVEILAVDFASGERELRGALDMALGMEERDQVSQIAAALSQVLSTLGRSGEAERFASMSMETAPSESVMSQALSRAARARVMAGRDGDPAAEQLAREAVRLAPAEMLNFRADLLVNLAEVLRAKDDRNGAAPIIREAIELYERKGNLVSAARARSFGD
jgi:DNA-binding SARP family transcriptional activator/class 3 adenylate cyclase